MDPLKSLLDSKKARIKELKAEKKKLEKQKKQDNPPLGIVDNIVKLDKKIFDLEQFAKRFSPSKMQPVQIKTIVINYKLYLDFIKKLKGFFITEEVKDGSLVIKYYKGNTSGELVLQDLTEFFPEDSTFPEGKLQEVSIL